jgi:putative peptidoglycan lipid II flippase
VRRFARLVASEVGGSAVSRINPVVDQLLAGLTGVVGGGTLLRYACDVALVPTSLLQAALLSVLLSHLSEQFAQGQLATVEATVRRALGTVIALLFAASAALYLVRRPLLRLVYQRGAMDALAVEQLADLFPYFLVGLAPFGALLVLARAHVAIQNSRLMIRMGILVATSNLLFDLVLLKLLGLRGIALATSAVNLVAAMVFWRQLRRRLTELRV